ncbi:uncharacterized protein [Drosophila tropicalis]|uniref:uncharacterized protein n=1 Tax=Drosophila tropicalis TaxID=46794 RepID=UPI0035AB7BA4
MALILLILFILVLSAVAYVIFIIHQKGLNPKEIRIDSINDVQKLLTPLPSGTTTPLKYLEKIA